MTLPRASDTSIAPGAPEAGRGPWAAELSATMALAWPLVLSSLGQVAMTATDVAMVGRLGPDPLAAAALGSNLYFVCFIFGVGVLGAVSSMLSRAFGQRRHAVREARRTVRQGFWTAAIIALPAWALLWNADILLRLLGQEERLIADAASYVRTLQWGLLPILMFFVLRGFVSALERPRWALLITLCGVALNALLNWLLIYGSLGAPKLGLPGAGIASSIVALAMAAAFAAVVLTERRFRRYRLFGSFWRADWPRLAQLWRLGLPLALTLLFEVGIFSAAVFLIGLMGSTALAAHQIAIQIASIAFMAPLGVGQAVTVRVGLAFGARDRERARRAAVVSLALGVGFMALTALMMVTVPKWLIAVFLDLRAPENREVVELAVTLLMVGALFQIVDGAQAVAIGMLRGAQDTRVPMLLALLGYWGVGFPLGVVLAFPLGFGPVGVWLGLAAGLGVVSVLLLRRWERVRMRLAAGLSPPRPAD
jgi:MATE family multidrug resistance protein